VDESVARRLGLILAVAVPLVTAGLGCEKSTTTTAPTLTADCAANPSSGTAPLSVTFVLNVSGAQGSFSVAIAYGDGASGTDPDQPHRYTAAGSYTASFTVVTDTQSARCSAPVTVAAPQPTPTPTPGPNQPPQPVFKTTPAANGSTISGTAPLVVNFNLCQTADPDGDPLRFRMDLDGNGAFEYEGSTGVDCRHPATYGAGTHDATICVTDIVCPSWPVCAGYPTLHPFQCRSYSIVVTP
jgi:hypothetical protein